jgi:hypothetical protein
LTHRERVRYDGRSPSRARRAALTKRRRWVERVFASVPTLSEWALVAMMIAIAITGAIAVRRQLLRAR